MHQLILIIIAMLFANGCRQITDEGNTTIKCQAVNVRNKQAVPFARITIMAYPANGSILDAVQVAQAIADADGKSTFSFFKNKNTKYIMLGDKDWFQTASENNYSSLPDAFDGKTLNQVLMTPLGVLMVHLKNVAPASPDDNLNFSTGGAGSYRGESIDDTTYSIVWGDFEAEIVYFLRENGTQKSYKQNVFCKSFDTTLYELNY